MNTKHLKEEKSFVLIKPDGVRKGLIGEIVKRIEQRDLKIVAIEMFQPTKEQIQKIICLHFKLKELAQEDATDALAVALCHSQTKRFK